MTVAIVKKAPTPQSGANSPKVVNFGQAATAGNLLVISYLIVNQSTYTQPAGYSIAIDTPNSGGIYVIGICYKFAAGGETTASFSSGGSFDIDAECYEVSGIRGTSPLDQTNRTTTHPLLPIQPGSITPTFADEFVVTCAGNVGNNGGSEAIDSGFTLDDAATFNGGIFGNKIISSLTALNPSMSCANAGQADAVIASFMGVLGSAPMTRRNRQGVAVHRAATR